MRLTLFALRASLSVTALPSLVVPAYLAPPGSAASATGAVTARAAIAAGMRCLCRSIACPTTTQIAGKGCRVATSTGAGYVGLVGSTPTNEVLRRDADRLGVVEHAALTDVGREREGNEDSFLAGPPLFVVADGMGAR